MSNNIQGNNPIQPPPISSLRPVGSREEGTLPPAPTNNGPAPLHVQKNNVDTFGSLEDGQKLT